VNLEQAIHERWAADGVLSSLLSAEEVVTGNRSGSRVPYATIHRRENRTLLRTNAGDAVDEAVLLIHVWHDDYDVGRAILERVKAAFDRSDFPLAGNDRVIRMCRTTDSARQHDDGLWQFSIEFSVQVYLASGV